MGSDSLVHVHDLYAGYGGGDILKGLSFDLHHGDVFALIGPNGAGKSTLARVLTGALRARSGDVRLQAFVGFVPQQIALYPWLSVQENVFAFAHLSGLSRRLCHARIAHVLALTGCTHVASLTIPCLSGGYQRRANIAVALMNNPRLLILDEPTAGLDVEGRAHILNTIQTLREAGVAILLITHDFDLVERVATCIGILHQGTWACLGALDVLISTHFGDCERVEFLLREPLSPQIEAKLTELGARPGQDPQTFYVWRKSVRDEDRTLAAAGLACREWRVRPAKLEDLFAHLVLETPT